MTARALAVLFALGASASADRAKLELTHEPPPRHLRMRPRTAAAVTPEPAREAVPDAEITATAPDADAIVGQVRDLRQPISVRLNIGYVVDGTQLSGKTTLSQQQVSTSDFGLLRAYALGEGYFSSRGVLFPSLSTYIATRFQITNQTRRRYDPGDLTQPEIVVPPPIANWFERSGIEPRAYWAEVKDFLPDARLAPLRLRAGEQYVYGPWVLHMYGPLAAWEGKLVRATAYSGSRVPDYTLVEVNAKDRSLIAGGSVRIDLTALKSPIPFAVSTEVLRFTSIGVSHEIQDPSSHALLQLDWRPRKDIALIGRVRTIDGELANEHLQLRSRYKQVTNFVFDLMHRRVNDWRWDPSVASNDPLAAKRWLDLGPSVPRLLFSARGGTLIQENVDVLVRGAVANDFDDSPRSTWNASYFELGGALELRARRTIAFGLSGLTRQSKRYATVTGEIPDVPMQIDPLYAQSAPEIGERGFAELGVSSRLNLGARRFSMLLEIYGRRTRYALDYCNALKSDGSIDTSCMSALDTGILDVDYRGGGRATIDAWIGQRLRLFASYDVSSRLDLAREITGYRSLRLMMEGVY